MKTYINGNYRVIILKDGTKIRRTEDDEFKPAFAENFDCLITEKCSCGCKFCYEGCTSDGKHADLFKHKEFLDSLHPYTEMAMNGNDLDHPDLIPFLEFLKTKNIFANITVHQNQFLKNYDLIKKLQDEKMIYGIGVSLQNPTTEFIEKLTRLKNTVLHTINGILTEDNIKALKNKGIKILILGYKELERGIDYKASHLEEIEKNQKYLYDNLGEMKNWFNVVSFDNLSLEQLEVKRLLSAEEWENFYMGDDGGFTFYVDLVKGEFAKNSLAQERFPIGDKNVDEMFNFIKEKYETNNQEKCI